MTEPTHSDVEILHSETGFERFSRIDVFDFRHRLFSGGWSGERRYDVLRRGAAVAVVLYDPDRDSVVLVEQLRLPALLAGASPWQVEIAAGLVDPGETPKAVAARETREETGLAIVRRADPDPALPAILRRLGRERLLVLRPRRCRGCRPVCTAWRRKARTSASSSKPWPRSRRCSTPAASKAATRSIGLYWLLRHRERLRQLWAPA